MKREESMMNEARKVANQILASSRLLPLQIFIRAKRGALVRFTNNGIHQSGFQDLFTYTLHLLGQEGPVYLESNDGSNVGIQEALKRIRALVSKPIPFPKSGKSVYAKIKEHFPLTIERIPMMAAQAIEQGIDLIRGKQASANGYFSAYERSFYFKDSKGLELFHPATAVRFGVTVTRGGGKGYHSFYHADPKKLNVASVIKEASELAQAASSREVSVKPGVYECIFHPRAFLELIEPIRPHSDRELYQNGKSAFSSLLGQRIFSKAFTLSEDITHSQQFGVPFDVEGMPKKKVALIERGVLKGLLGEGNSMRGISEHPVYPQNLVAEGGNLALQSLFKGIRNGIFINKVRYHTLVREKGLKVTGLVTAGSLSIEKGRVLGRVGHLRYHDSLMSLLGSVINQTKERVLLKDGEGGAALLPYFLISRLRVV